MADDEKTEGEIPSLEDFWSTGGEAGKAEEAPEGGGEAGGAAGGGGGGGGDVKVDAGWDQALQDMASGEPIMEAPKGAPPAHAKEFATIEATAMVGGEARDLDIILDIPLEVTAELGKTKMMISDFLKLGLGSIIELQKLAGEPVEILINGTLVARGEVVVVNEKFGVRLTDIVAQVERIKRLA